MSQPLKEKTLLMLQVNEILALEREIMERVALQVNFDAVLHNQEASAFLQELALSTATRYTSLADLSQTLESCAGLVKEVVAAGAGVLAGLYGNVRKHAVSRILRDNYTALSLTCTSYSMLYTTGLALGSEHTAAIALEHLSAVTPLVIKLSHMIPGIVVTELSVDFPDLNQEASAAGRKATVRAWSHHQEAEVA